MGRPRNDFIASGAYRPQRPKARRKQRRQIFCNSAVLVDRVREMMEQSREEETGMGRIYEDGRDGMKMVYKKEAKTFQFNKGRPIVDREERRMVKKNLFGEEGSRSSVNAKLRKNLMVKKKLIETNSRHSHQLDKRASLIRESQPGVAERVSSWVSSQHFQPNPALFPFIHSFIIFSLTSLSRGSPVVWPSKEVLFFSHTNITPW